MIRCSILGRIALERSDGSVVQSVLAQPKRMALLSFLALRGGRGVPRDLLVETFWPELEPERGRAALRKGLHYLRQSLGAETIGALGGDVAVSPESVWCDVVAFEEALKRGELEAALELYGGELLPGLAVSGARGWDTWLDGERSRLRRQAAEAAAAAYERAKGAGDVESAWRHLGKALAIDPAGDAPVCQALRYAAAVGDPERGLRLYGEYRARLAAEWELEPSPECSRLAETLLAQRTELLSGDVRTPTSPAQPVAPAESERPAPASGARPRRAWRAAVAAAALIGAISVVLAVRLAGEGRPGTGALAVGAIRDLTPADSAAAAAIPELLTTNLGRARGLELISATRLLELADGSAPSSSALTAAARRAGAREVVEGALFRRGDALQLDLRRVDATTGEVQAAYSVSGDDVFGVVDAATTALLRDLLGDAPDLRVADVATGSLVALRFYQEGLRLYLRGPATDARPLFAAALREDSTFAMAAYYLAVTAQEFDVDMLQRALRLSAHVPERERLLIRTMWLQHMDDPRRLAAAESLVVRYPHDPAGYLALGRAQFWGGDFAGAVQTLTQVIAMDSATPVRPGQPCRACEADFDLSSLYLHLDSGRAAERVARRYLAVYPESDRGWDMLINALEHQGRYDELLAALQQFAALSGNAAAAHHRRAAVAIRRGDFATADSLLGTGDPLDPHGRNRQLWYRMISLRSQGRLAEALSAADEYEHVGRTQLNAVPPVMPVLRGILLHEAGEHARAAALFEQAARPQQDVPSRQARNRAWNLTHAAAAYAALGDSARLRVLADTVQRLGALSAYARDVKLHHHIRGLDAVLRGDTARAIQHLRNAIFSLTRGYTRTNLELGTLLNATGRHEEAIAVLEPALRGTLDSSQLYVTHALLHEQLLIARRALKDFERARLHDAWLQRARRGAASGSAAVTPADATGRQAEQRG